MSRKMSRYGFESRSSTNAEGGEKGEGGGERNVCNFKETADVSFARGLRVLQCVAVIECVVMCGSVLQCIAVCCSVFGVLQHSAVI